MNIFTWILQTTLALHTGAGAYWKFSHSAEQTMPSLAAIPETVWMTMSWIEIACAIGLLLPALSRTLGILAPVAAALIGIEMLVFCAIHLNSGDTNLGPMIYWLIIASLCTFIVIKRSRSRP